MRDQKRPVKDWKWPVATQMIVAEATTATNAAVRDLGIGFRVLAQMIVAEATTATNAAVRDLVQDF